MIGAIAGDIVGSVYEGSPIKTKDFLLFSPSSTFTDDSVLMAAVAEAILCFLDSTSYEHAVRNAVSLGGDSDTLACIAGGIAEAFYGPVPETIQATVRHILPPDLLKITDRFYSQFMHR